MATTQAQATVMAQTAARFDQVNAALDAMLKRLLTELEALRTQWQGSGARSFEQVKNAWAADQAMLSRTLGETAEAIRRSGVTYAAADEAAAARMSPGRPVLDLPL